jgi:hypothetical protein
MSVFDSSSLEPPRYLGLKNGLDYSVEEQADKWLAKGREGVTALCDKRDYLTKDQLQLRASKEVLNINGVPDEALFSGLFRRAHNPLSNSRPRGRAHTE